MRVLVMGAGLAGLTAAYRLRQQRHEVLVLEARERVGGRVHTVTLGNRLYFDLGGEWVGKKHRHLRQLADELGVMLVDHRMRFEIRLRGRKLKWGDLVPKK